VLFAHIPTFDPIAAEITKINVFLFPQLAIDKRKWRHIENGNIKMCAWRKLRFFDEIVTVRSDWSEIDLAVLKSALDPSVLNTNELMALGVDPWHTVIGLEVATVSRRVTMQMDDATIWHYVAEAKWPKEVHPNAKVNQKCDLRTIFLLARRFLPPGEIIAVLRAWGYRSEYAMASYLLSYLCNDMTREVVQPWLMEIKFWQLDDKAAIQLLKTVHNVVRKYAIFGAKRLDKQSQVKLEYLNDLFAKDLYVQDFTDALMQRTVKGPSVRLDPLDKEPIDDVVFRLATQLLQPVKGARVLDIEQFGDRVCEWVAAGSSPNTRITVLDEGKNVKLQGSKRLWAESKNGAAFREMLSTEPRSISTVTPKFENGKNRDLMSDSETNYAMQSYLLYGVEELLGGHYGMLFKLGGQAALQQKNRILMRTMRSSGAYFWSYDFKNFQMNHSLESQKAVWAALINIRINQAKHEKNLVAMEHYRRAGEWVIGAIDNCYVRDIATGLTIKNRFGLATGVRGTAFINTVLNKVYDSLAGNLATTWLEGDPEDPRVGWHMGDDIMRQLSSLTAAVARTRAMSSLGLTGTDIKLLIEPDGGELLRYYYSKGSVMGYMNRTIPNIICGEWDLGVGATVLEKARSVPSVCGKLRERGANSVVVATLEQMLVRRVSAVNFNEVKQRFTVEYLGTSVITGGLGVMTNTIGRPIIGKRPRARITIPKLYDRGVAAQVAGVGSVAYTGRVIDAYGLGRERRLQMMIREGILVNNLSRSWPARVVKDWYSEVGSRMQDLAVIGCDLGETWTWTKDSDGDVSLAIWMWRRIMSGQPVIKSEVSYSEVCGLWTRVSPPDRLAFTELMRPANSTQTLVNVLSALFIRNKVAANTFGVHSWAAHVGVETTKLILLDDIEFDEVCDLRLHEDIRATIRSVALMVVKPIDGNTVTDIKKRIRSIETALSDLTLKDM